jgi:PAS domain S-box-containing protein
VNFFLKLLSADFMPHVYCLRLPEVIRLFVVSNAGIALAYFAIPPTLLFFVRKRRDIAFSWMFLLFGLFILACGTTHILDIVTLWVPVYRLDVVIRTVTAVASIGTALMLVRILPEAIQLPNPEQLRSEISKRIESQRQLEILNRELEDRVAERTATLHASNANLEKAVEELRYQLELNRAITTQAGDAILSTDEHGEIKFANPQASCMFGYSTAELEGGSFHQILHLGCCNNENVDDEDCVLMEAVRTGRPLNDWSAEFYRKDGRPVPVACSAGPINVNGRPSGAVIIVRDVTERVQAERAIKESEAQYRTLVEAMPHLVWSARLDGTVEFRSQQWFEFTGDDDSMPDSGTRWHDYIHPEDLQRTKEGWQSCLVSLANYEVEHRIRRYDGAWLWFKTRAVVTRSETGEPCRWLATSTDIDADRRANQVLAQYNSDLRNLSSALAHDLHEPLRTVATQTQLLARLVHDELSGKGTHLAEQVVQSAVQMRRILQDITIYSDAITRPLNLQWIHLEELVHAVLARRGEKMENTDICVQVSPDLQVEADQDALRIIFRQLFDNAFAYRHPQRRLQIAVSAQIWDAEVVVAVADNGVGIDPEYQERVFELFKRLHRQDQHPGSGVGLAMCHKLLQRHGKRIWTRPNPDGGTIFYLTLNRAQRLTRNNGAYAPATG